MSDTSKSCIAAAASSGKWHSASSIDQIIAAENDHKVLCGRSKVTEQEKTASMSASCCRRMRRAAPGPPRPFRVVSDCRGVGCPLQSTPACALMTHKESVDQPETRSSRSKSPNHYVDLPSEGTKLKIRSLSSHEIRSGLACVSEEGFAPVSMLAKQALQIVGVSRSSSGGWLSVIARMRSQPFSRKQYRDACSRTQSRRQTTELSKLVAVSPVVTEYATDEQPRNFHGLSG